MTPEQASKIFPWVKYNPETNEMEMFLDHHMLSTMRLCEGKFQLEHILNIRPKGHRAWALTWGAWVHYALEDFYEHIRKHEKPPVATEWLETAKKKWVELKVDTYKGVEDKYDDIGGWEGACSFLVQYYAFYMEQRLRVIATEIPFGFNREVPLGEFWFALEYDSILIRCYLTGRIDLLVDNGYMIGPVDHKNTHIFRGDEWDKFNPQDGITGYIFGTNTILKNYVPEWNKQCLSGWIFHLQAHSSVKERKTSKLRPRFKASRIDKMPSQLDDYIARNLETFKRVAQLVLVSKVPEWSTTSCHNIYNRDCEYLQIHKQPREEWQYQIQTHYNITLPWNPNKPEDSTISRDDVTEALIALDKEKEKEKEGINNGHITTQLGKETPCQTTETEKQNQT